MSFFCQCGTESVEGALKLARYVSGRGRFIGFLGGFHGRTMGSLSFTSSKYTQQKGFFPTMPGVTHVPYPNHVSPAVRGRRSGRGGARLHRECCSSERAGERSRGDPDRADPGRRRLSRAAGRFPAGPARAVRRARHPADLRRSAVGHRPHRQDVRVPSTSACARHHDARERPRLRAADRHGGREEDDDGAVAARRARQHLRRQSAVLRGCARDDRPGATEYCGERGAHGRILHRQAARAAAASTPASATCAARA